MADESPSPFARATPGLRLRKFVSTIPRVTKEQSAAFPEEAQRTVDATWAAQARLVQAGTYDNTWIEGRHFLVAGATGLGLGGCIAAALLNHLEILGSLTVIGRDLRRSLEYETGIAMTERAERAGVANRFHWLNDGLALEREALANIVAALKKVGANRVIYINTVAAASSGILPGCPPVFVKDIDEEGLLQWELSPLNERSVEATKFIMGTLAVRFPDALEQAGVPVEATAFADWRGSLDGCSRIPANVEYGRQGPYSTSLYLPKVIVQRATAAAYRSGKTVIDLFLPLMKTRALYLIPGGRILYHVYAVLMSKVGIRRIDVPELALAVLERVGRALRGTDENPFPRLDTHEAQLDLWFYEILQRLNNDKDSEFYYKKWIDTV